MAEKSRVFRIAMPRKGGRRCVAGGCSSKKTSENGISLHSFPVDRPAILRQWVKFVKVTRKNWSGPSKHSVLCSLHFNEECYPTKFRMMDSMGVKELEKEAVPTIQPFTPVSPLEGEKRQSDSPLSSTPKRPTRTFQNREVDRVRWVQFHNSLLECNVIYKQPKYIYNSLLVCNVIYKQPKHI